MKKYVKNDNIYLVFAFIIMVVLFVSSSQTYEQQSQVGTIQQVMKNRPFEEQLRTISFVYAGSPVSIAAKGYAGFVEFFIRKGAHFFTYFCLGGCWFLGLRRRIKQPVLTAIVSCLAAAGYAGLDEYHQMITGGRSPLFEDVMLDTIGALTAVSIALIILLIRKIRK